MRSVPMPYCQLNSMLDAGYPKGALNYWKSSFLARLSDDAIDTMIEYFDRCPTPMGQVLLEHFHGAATRVGATDTAFPHRTGGLQLPGRVADHGPRDLRPVHGVGAADLRGDGTVHRVGPICELPG